MKALFRSPWFLPLLPLLASCGTGGPPSTPEPQRAPAHADSIDRPVSAAELSLPARLADRVGARLAVAGPGTIVIRRELPGVVRPNGDRLAHVAPRVGGIAREVRVSLGDRVERGELLAVLESPELARARAAWLAARARVALARATFAREERLHRQGVTAEQDRLNAWTALQEAEIARKAARQSLLAMGVTPDELNRAPNLPQSPLATLELRAPLTGEVTARHMTPGEAIAALVPVFTVADLQTTWVDLSVYPRDLSLVSSGAEVIITARGGTLRAVDTIDYVSPLLGQDTRTAIARVVLPNPRGAWRPGMFVTGTVTVHRAEVPVAVPLRAVLHTGRGATALFVDDGRGNLFLREVSLGRRDDRQAEVLTGLSPHERYVVEGGFALLAELRKGSFGHDEH